MVDRDRILFVDDEPGVRDVICGAVERWGYKITCVGNAEDAMAVFKNEKPFLTMTDLRLDGDISGAMLATKLHRENPFCIFIALTGFMEAFGFGYLIGSVFTDVMVKPVVMAELKRLIDFSEERSTRWAEWM